MGRGGGDEHLKPRNFSLFPETRTYFGGVYSRIYTSNLMTASFKMFLESCI